MSVYAVKSPSAGLTEADITNYWQHYDLHYDPFATEIDERNYYSLPRWEEHLDLLQFLCHYNNVLLAVTGSSGSGKTVLMQQFHKQIVDSMRVCEVKASTTFSNEQLVETLSEAFHLKVEVRGTPEQQLDNLITQLQESQKICLLLIDDAHLLPLKILHTFLSLIQLQSDTQMKLHIVLFGEPHLQNNIVRLTQAEGGEEFVHILQLGVLSLEETEGYLQHRLLKSGFEEMPLVQTVINRIYKLSGGVPGRINRIARRTLLNDLLKRQPEEKPSLIHINKTKFLGALLVATMVVIAAIMINMVKGNDFQFVKLKKIDPLLAFNRKVTPIAATSHSEKPLVTAATAEKQLQPASSSMQMAMPKTVAIPTTVVLPVNEPAASANNVELKVNKDNELVITETTTSTSTAPTSVDISTAAAPVSQQSTSPAVSPSDTAKVAVKPPVAPSKVIAKATAMKANRYSTSEKRLLAINSTSYGLQLLGLSNEAAVKRFITIHKLAGKANYYHTSLKGKDWYVLIYGTFPTPAQAKQALTKLPVEIQMLKPWVKDYHSVHTAIKQAK